MTPSRVAEAVERLENTIRVRAPAARFRLVDIREDQNEQAWGLLVYSHAGPWELSEIIGGEISNMIAKQGLAICVMAAPLEVQTLELASEAWDLEALLQQPLGAPVHLTRKQARAIVQAGIGRRPDLPAGTVYVRNIREAWRGLTRRGASST